MLKVLHIVARLSDGSGIAESVVGLVRALSARQQIACAVMTYYEKGLAPYLSRCMDGNVAMHTAQIGWRHTIWYSRDWLRQLTHIAPHYDVVHIHGVWLYPHFITAYWCIRHRKPFVISPHGALLSHALAQSKEKKKWLIPIIRGFFKRAAVLHVTSTEESEAVQRFLGQRSPHIAHIVEGIEYPLKPATDKKNQEVERVVIYLGRISPEKNVHVLLDAWEKVDIAVKKGWRLRVVGFPPIGESPFADCLALRCQSLHDVSSESFCNVERKWEVLSGSQLLVLPSITENFGLVVLEALACGVPVIATKGTPWQELTGIPSNDSRGYNPGRAGWWIDLGVDPLVDALKEAMSLTDHERQKMGENGQALVEHRYQWSMVAFEIEKMYKGIVHRDTVQGSVT